MARKPQKRNRIPGVYSYTTKRGEKRWAAVWEVGTPPERRQKRKRGFRTQDEAAEWRGDYLAKQRRGDITEPSLLPLREWLTIWLERRSTRIRPSTTKVYRGYFNLISDVLGSVPLARLTASQIEAAYAQLADCGLAPSTQRRAHAILRSVLRTAVRDRMIAHNPCDSVDPPGKPSTDRPTWTIDQARSFLDRTENTPYSDAWHLFLETWIRNGEARALRWSDLDLMTGLMRITRTATIDADGKAVEGPVKTERSRRTIPLSDELLHRLKRRRRRQQIEALEFGSGWSDSRHIFTTAKGGPVYGSTFCDALRTACTRLELPYIGVHGLRHTGGSIAYAARVPIKVISERMGHSSATITHNLYMHTDDQQHRDLATEISALLAPNRQNRDAM